MTMRPALWLLPALLLVMLPIDADAKGGKPKGNGNGPAFCRNGAGHPVHGWEWCRAKGWAGRGWFDTDDRRRPRVAIPRGRVPDDYRFPDDYPDRDGRWRLGDWLPF